MDENLQTLLERRKPAVGYEVFAGVRLEIDIDLEKWQGIPALRPERDLREGPVSPRMKPMRSRSKCSLTGHPPHWSAPVSFARSGVIERLLRRQRNARARKGSHPSGGRQIVTEGRAGQEPSERGHKQCFQGSGPCLVCPAARCVRASSIMVSGQ
jgi:hypothetical protein